MRTGGGLVVLSFRRPRTLKPKGNSPCHFVYACCWRVCFAASVCAARVGAVEVDSRATSSASSRDAAHAERVPRGLRRARPPLLAAARRLRHQAELDDAEQRITATETITYHNNSPDTLSLPLAATRSEHLRARSEANRRAPRRLYATPEPGDESPSRPRPLLDARPPAHAGHLRGRPPRHGRARRARRRAPLHRRPHDDADRFAAAARAGQESVVHGRLELHDQRREALGGRTGYEFFEEDGNYIYDDRAVVPAHGGLHGLCGLAAQAVPRHGRVHAGVRQLQVHLTVPDDHVVAATGALQNADEVLSQRSASV